LKRPHDLQASITILGFPVFATFFAGFLADALEAVVLRLGILLLELI
jgi:hypothetical protein